MPLDINYLVERFRLDMSDPELPGDTDDSDSLWQDEEIKNYIYEAQEALCEHVDLLVDRSTYSFTTVADTDLYALDGKVTKVRKGMDPDGNSLPAFSVRELERRYQAEDLGWLSLDWEGKTGKPKYLVTDYAFGFLRVVPVPTTDEAGDLINLDVYRLPADKTLEVPDKFRLDLLWKAKELAYRKDDVDVQDVKKADMYEAKWLDALHKMDKQIKRLQRGAQVVAYGGI